MPLKELMIEDIKRADFESSKQFFGFNQHDFWVLFYFFGSFEKMVVTL